jgi:predicted nuclease with TOPRIM domain
MDTESAINFLVEHQAVLDGKLDKTATKEDVQAVKETMLKLQAAMLHYAEYAQNLLQSVRKGQLSLEDRFDAVNAEMQQMQQRIAELEKRNPPQAA